MSFDIPIRKTPVLDSQSLADKRGFMNIRNSLDKNHLDNESFRKVYQQQTAPERSTSAPVRNVTAEPVPARPQRKQRNLPAGNVYLKKGQKVPVDDSSTIRIALGWDILDTRCELDGSAFMLGADGKVLGDEWFIFYGQDSSPDNSMKYHSGSNPDDAVIDIDFRKINPAVERIVFSVTIYEAIEKGLNFGMTENVYSRIIDSKNNEVFRFQLDECYNNVTAMVLGELYRYKGNWKFNAVGSGVARDLAGFCAMYGVNLV